MKASLRSLTLGLLLLVPVSAAHAQGPLLSPIANVSLNAGLTMNVNVVAVDVEGRVITITAALPPFATLNTPTIGKGVVVTTLTLAPSSAHVGDYSAAVMATAGGVSSTRVFQITVNAMGSNQAPIVVAPPLQEVTAGSTLSFTVTASDADADAITSLSASDLPAGATFTPNGSNTSAAFNWTPVAADAGEYDVSFTASNALSATAVTHIRVASPPTLTITPIDDVTVPDGGSVSVPVHASGVPGELITLTAALPTFATLNPPGSGTGAVSTTVTVSPPTGSAGTYHASITATSPGGSVSEPFDIIVTGTGGGENHAPVVTAPATATVAEGSTLSFDISATDPDGDHVDLLGSALPPGSSFIDHANETGTFTWTPAAGQAGTYTASFTGLDNRGGSGSASTTITVTGGAPPENHAPNVSAPSTEHVDEGVNLSFSVTATDQDGDHVTLSANSVPPGATFTDHGDNTGAFSWTPGSTQSGTYVVAFLGNDGHGGTGTASTTITVMDVGGGGGGGGGGEVAARACLVKKFKVKKDPTCFLIKPFNRSFDVRDVVLSSIRLRFHGESIAALDGARIELHCQRGDHGGDDGDDDGDDHPGDHGDGDHGGHGDGDQGGHGNGDQGGHGNGDQGGHGNGDQGGHGNGDQGGHGNGDKGHHDNPVSLDGDRDDDEDDGNDPCNLVCHHGVDHEDCGPRGCGCDTLGIRACFSTDAILGLFESGTLPCALLDAEIVATLTNGATIVATFSETRHHPDDDKDKDKGKGKDGDKNGDDAKGTGGILSFNAKPNPLNPATELSFTMSHEGRVRVMVYDMQGRLVKTLLNDFRSAGQQTLAWDGSNEWNRRVASGVYLLRIQTLEGSITHRVAVVK